MEKPSAKQIQEAIKDFKPKDEGLLIPILQAVQEKFGYLPPESLKIISRHTRVSASKIYGVMTFYAQFTTIPRGKYVIKVCRGTACHVRGSAKVIEYIKSKLDVADGGTTPDNKFTLETVACLGACFLAPAMMVNQDYYGNMAENKVAEVLENYK
jgi:NADH-quinone oxidoreductase E subunit